MKAILTYSLYRRSKATNEEDAIGYLPAGSVIEVTRIEAGKMLDGISVWFFAEDGFYYWGGGVNFNDESVFGDWQILSEDLQKALLESLVADELFWFQKKVVGYVGCGWGYKNDDEKRGLAVSMFVSKKTPDTVLNDTIRYKGYNILIDVKEVSPFKHHTYKEGLPPLQSDIFDPIEMGGSISLQNSSSFGTRSLILKNKENKDCLMTCFHVLLAKYMDQDKFQTSPSQMVFADSPSPKRNPKNAILRKNIKVIEGRFNSYYDFDVTELPPKTRYTNAFNDFVFKDYYLLEDLKSLVGKVVTMGGAASSQQSGIVKDVQGSIDIEGGYSYSNVVITEKISIGGDSGAPVVDQNGKLVGIVVAGDEQERTLVLPITYLFTLLDYQLL